jgi:hypothetical protein
VTDPNLKTRVVFAALKPAVRLGMTFGVSLKDIKNFTELAYYQEARHRGMKMREMSELMDISMSKVGLLSKKLKEHYLEPELEHGVGRQILSLLWASPLSEARLVAALPDYGPHDVKEALDRLLAENRIRLLPGRTESYELTSGAQRLDIAPWMAKIDGLNTLLSSVSKAVEARFHRDDPRTFVRNLAFRVRKQDFERLQKLYETAIFPLIVELDEAVTTDDESVPVRLSVLWSAEEEHE